MTSAGSYDVRTAHQDRGAELERLAAQAKLGWENEAAMLERCGFHDGTSIIELGSGPGFVTKLLLDHFPGARVTGVELDPELIADATDYLADYGDRVSFVHASVAETGLASESFDAAYARLLFQHLPDPVSAATEIRRILRPGAPLVIYDVDDGMDLLIDPEVPGLLSVMERMRHLQAAQGGDRHIGRQLVRILKAAGFEQVDIEPISTNTEREGIDPFLHQFEPGRLSPLIRGGLLTQDEADELIRQREIFLASDPFIMFVSLMAGGSAPRRSAEGRNVAS